MALKMVKVTALRDSLYYESVPYCRGNVLEIPEHMLDEWLALKHVRIAEHVEPPDPWPRPPAREVTAEEAKAEAPLPTPEPQSEDELLRKMLEEEEAKPAPRPRTRMRIAPE